MRRKNFSIPARFNSESGQVMLFTVLGLGLFLIGAMAFAIDMSNMWFHRQSAQTAADAACTAGAMDMLTDQTNNISAAPYPGHFTPGGSAFSCNTTTPNSGTPGTTNPSPCVYAALNGYTSNITNASWKSGTLGNDVEVSSCWATKACSSPAPPLGVSTAQYMEVDVYENMPTFFAGLLNGRSSQSIRAVSKCGVNISAAPIPLIVLDPLNPDSKTSAFNISGTPTVQIYGGPQQSIQVNSSDTSKTEAVTINGSALVNLTQGGPNHTGSSMGITGGPNVPPSCGTSKGFCAGSTGSWMDPHSPIQDPLRFLSPPTKPNAAAAPTQNIASGTAGCGAPSGSTCWEFSAGDYPADSKGNSICIGASCKNSTQYAIFDPGVYYMEGNLSADDNSCLRISSNTGDGSGGIMFYFVGSSATLSFTANTGSKCPTSTVLFNTATGGPTGQGVYCDSTAAANGPGNVPATLNGNVLLAPCTGTYGDQNYNSKKGRQRGILFYQDRSGASVTSNAGGGGSYAMAGTFYFHSCNSSNTSSTCTYPTGTYASSGTYFLDTLVMGGGSGASSYILGEIIVDNLQLQGTPTIYMDLNPSTVNNIYKAALYQ